MRRALTIVALIAITAAPAAAQSTTAQAEAMFRRGQELLAQGKIAEACDAFDASQRLEPAVTTQLNQGNCRVKNRQLATAWGVFVDAARKTRGAKDPDLQALNKVAADQAQKLESRLSTLSVVVSDASRIAGLEILLDGHAMDAALWNQAVPVDGGAHEVTARAPGNVDWRSSVTVGVERDAKTIEIPRLKEAALDTDRDDKTEPRSTTIERDAPRSRSRRAPLLVGAVAVALGGTAVGLALWGDSTYDKALEEPDRERQLDLWHSAERKRYAAQGAGIVAVGCAGAAIWLFVRSGGDDHSDDVQAGHIDVVPSVGTGSASVSVFGHF